ncbi:MAG: hypothetical protein JST68_00525 [Bacteroidetes bacterium]|nr:hypothetical protein [Bacteroidota bacterium]
MEMEDEGLIIFVLSIMTNKNEEYGTDVFYFFSNGLPCLLRIHPSQTIQELREFMALFSRKGTQVSGHENEAAEEIMPARRGVYTAEQENDVRKVIERVEEPVQQVVGNSIESRMSLAEALSGEIKQLVQKAAKEGAGKEHIVSGLQTLLRREEYEPLNDGPFNESIKNLIRFDVTTNCSIHLSNEELDGLWEE